ncbi:MAG: putative HAD-hydrolase YfnB [Anaerolineales bacterium]|nr:putative HAD-hydrolase YfnB [Anaerolineales bacterium]
MSPANQSALVISFDMDQVLVPSPIGNRIFPLVAAELAQEITNHRTGSPEVMAGKLRHRVHEEWQHRLRNGDDIVSAYDWDDIFTVTVQRLGLSRQVYIAPYVEAFCEHPHNLPTYPEVPEQLANLREQGARLLLVTNGHARYQLPILRALGLDPFFHRIATPDRVGYGKPDPRIFRWAFRSLAGQRNVHVGDRLVHDVYGARRAGLETVWFKRDLPPELAELPPDERLAASGTQFLIETELAEECVIVDKLTPYWPEHVAKNLAELPALLGLAQGTKSRDEA